MNMIKISFALIFLLLSGCQSFSSDEDQPITQSVSIMPVGDEEGSSIDLLISTKIRFILLEEKNINSRDIDVEVDQGVVTLRGYVPKVNDIPRVINLASTVRGVKKVNSALMTESQKPVGMVEDWLIAANIRYDFFANEHLDEGSIDVEVNKGVVRLSGNVPTEAKRKRAGDVAAQVEGVKQIINNIKIHDIGYVEDWKITADIKYQYWEDDYIKLIDINVQTHDGVVILYGRVADSHILNRALAIAQSVKGVKKVNSKLMVIHEY